MYSFHLLALQPLIASNPAQALHHASGAIQHVGEKPFLTFLTNQGLAPLWHETLITTNTLSLFSPAFIGELQQISLHTTAEYLKQQHSLSRINDTLNTQSIPYALFKGAHIRELIYENPAVRSSCDIDILVAKKDKVSAIKALVAAGFTFRPNPENISHEAPLTDGKTSLDLHWDILRPGRTRVDLTDEFLHTRQQRDGYWHLDCNTTLFILLVHPVFTKYSTTDHASLIRLVDLQRWQRTQSIDWKKVLDYLERGGVKTAAWITAVFLNMLTGETLPEPFMQSIRPGTARSWYLRQWLKRNLATGLLEYPLLVQIGFTLAAHDTVTDALLFTRQLLKEKKQAARQTEELLRRID